jgi:hypothetical protein
MNHLDTTRVEDGGESRSWGTRCGAIVIFICFRLHLGTLPLAAYYRNMGLQYLISTSWPWQGQAPRLMFIIIRSKHPYARMVAGAGMFPVKVCKHKCRVNGTCERDLKTV